LSLDEAAELQLVTRRGLAVERETYQHLSDVGLLPPTATRVLLHEVDDQIEALGVGRVTLAEVYNRERPGFDRIVERITGWLPNPIGDDPTTLAYAEASARRLAARRTSEALEMFTRLPNIGQVVIDEARATFARWEEEAVTQLSELDADVTQDMREIHQQQAETLIRVASTDALEELAEIGILPEALARRAAETVATEVESDRGV
ncbi:MAG TPA: hypothetical protein VGR29_00510, partial [Thermomicrobiales bacterium]|nr:hypothetical protein [Thermomicrobiales bacterium]